ncbi:HEXXH motif-containing putative peptide modification protein, partial [Nocardia gamkensis]|uniref:aKG-HExxH-type peptide beta-hydroxylase n=1 Tax=Nocardia gamkensis TaxID=352869 RepID=UPI0033DF2AE6
AGSVAGLDLVRPLRCLTAEGISVVLEDTDPYRAVPYQGSEIYPVDQVSAAEAESWQRAFTAAIDIIDTCLPRYAPGLRAGLRTVLPLQSDGKVSRSASTRLAFGAVGLAPARLDGASLAELLVHEFQHVKMGAILDMFELYDLSDTEPRYHPLCFVHPRPIEGLLQGAYAHIGVTDYWRVRRTLVDGADRVEAERQFARWRMMTAEAIGQLRDSGSLTGLGERFVQAMGETVLPWLREPVDPTAEAAAREVAEEHREREARLKTAGQRKP